MHCKHRAEHRYAESCANHAGAGSGRNMSDEGANLEVESQIGIPNSFDLVVDSEHSNHQCHVVWRKAHRIGVAFD
jgi:hypothetical protein